MNIDEAKLQEILREPAMQDPFLYKLLQVLQYRKSEDVTMIFGEVLNAMSQANKAYKDMVIKITERLPYSNIIGRQL